MPKREGPPISEPLKDMDSSKENSKIEKPDSTQESAEQAPGQFVAPPPPADDDKTDKETGEKKVKKSRKKSSKKDKKFVSVESLGQAVIDSVKRAKKFEEKTQEDAVAWTIDPKEAEEIKKEEKEFVLGGKEPTEAKEELPSAVVEPKVEKTPQQLFKEWLDEFAKAENLDIKQKSKLYAFAHYRNFDVEEMLRDAKYSQEREDKSGDDEWIGISIENILKDKKTAIVEKASKETFGQAVTDGESEKIKKFMEENQLEDADAIKREIEAMRKNAPREKMQGKFGEIEKIKWDADSGERHKMLVRALRHIREKGKSGKIEDGGETNEEKVAKLQEKLDELMAKKNSGTLSDEEHEVVNEEMTKIYDEIDALEGKQTDESAETGKELMLIRDRVIEQMKQGKSLAERQTELEALDSRNPEEQAELDYIIRGWRINAIIQIFTNVEGKDSKEYWEKYGASFFEGYEQALKDATAGGAKEPDAEKFGRKMLEYLPDEGNPKMAELKKGGGEVLKKITDAIGEIFKEKDPAKQEEKSGESKELQQIKKIMGEDGFKEFMKTLLEAKERKEKGELTPEEAAKQKEKLEKAKGTIGGSMEKAWSIAGLVGIMLLLGLIFMIIVELEAIDWILKQGKGKH